MPWKDMGKVVGDNGTIGNINSTYINNGGEPGVSVTKSGDDSAPDITFEFENLVNDPLTSSEIEQISNDTQLTSSSVLNGTGLTTLWSRIKTKFAPKSHTHDASDITAGELAAILIANGLIDTDMLAAGAVTTTKIADGAVTKDKLEKTLGDSLSQAVKPSLWGDAGNRSVTLPLATDNNGDLYMLIASADGKLIYRRWHEGINTNVWAK
ncbi:hypothetical protein ADLECEL_13930 [Adlercreutzia equolifaciens subsp. celatus]|uniref:Uncharacterized protein n=1 Tax=Adlercreutzia equolifaciens subsp. celatus DSM 18785 TaxID=1121021 RepID=A0A3N0AUA5_9ACTN|nr:hypothetical protein [Adlercreutzia equolifaciens]MCP2077384.1 hypothetical protein [Adlercreutzia equolifaciens subsp. celatus DSM 18785]RFT92510.1 hypothetical protein DX904_06165 [Adlercreutzia equolifaciens subsp. celatus]RNL37886.1 hypothetical protein DMP10_06380 [Adlercreutzia equolifaciens subsp. celatus DSM 18785]BCS57508.1 hypothetical protein ADLECEL_13930 [Adlercreutzia equolifaciens subsp. celatus]